MRGRKTVWPPEKLEQLRQRMLAGETNSHKLARDFGASQQATHTMMRRHFSALLPQKRDYNNRVVTKPTLVNRVVHATPEPDEAEEAPARQPYDPSRDEKPQWLRRAA